MSRAIDWGRTIHVWEENQDVVAAWAFGSAQQGIVRPGGDVDVGVLMTSPPSNAEKMVLMACLMDALQVDEIDLVILNEAHAALRFEAVSGRCAVTAPQLTTCLRLYGAEVKYVPKQKEVRRPGTGVKRVNIFHQKWLVCVRKRVSQTRP